MANKIWKWIEGFITSIFGAFVCSALVGTVMFFLEFINLTGWEAVGALVKFIACLFFSIIGPYASGMSLKEDK